MEARHGLGTLVASIAPTLRSMWRHRWLALGVAWAAAIAGVLVVDRVPSKYEANARLFVDTDSILRPLMSGLVVQPDISQRLAILTRTLMSRPTIERLIDTTGIAPPGTDRERRVEEVSRTLVLRGGRDNIYSISFRHEDRDKARQVVDALLRLFVSSTVGHKEEDAVAARRFLDEQIATYAKRLDEAENRLKEFRLRHLDLGLNARNDWAGRVNEARQALEEAQMELRAAEESRNTLRSQLAAEEPYFSLASPQAKAIVRPREPSRALVEAEERFASQRRLLDELLARATEAHPDVIRARRMLEDLRRQLVRERDHESARPPEAVPAAMTPGDGAESIERRIPNPAYGQLRISLASAEANVASLASRVRMLDSRYRQGQKLSQAVPKVEAELTQLTRDYEVQKKSYESLVARRESASLSGQMDASGDATHFRVLDPPRVSIDPVWPNRMALLVVALLASLAAGIAAAWGGAMVQPTVADARGLRMVAGRPVLGSVALVVTPAVRAGRRRSRFAFATSCGLLLAVYAGALVVTAGAYRLI